MTTLQWGDTSIHPVLRSSSSAKIPVKSQAKKSGQVKGQTVITKGPVGQEGQESISYKGTTIDTYAMDGILRYSLREIDHVQILPKE